MKSNMSYILVNSLLYGNKVVESRGLRMQDRFAEHKSTFAKGLYVNLCIDRCRCTKIVSA